MGPCKSYMRGSWFGIFLTGLAVLRPTARPRASVLQTKAPEGWRLTSPTCGDPGVDVDSRPLLHDVICIYIYINIAMYSIINNSWVLVSEVVQDFYHQQCASVL